MSALASLGAAEFTASHSSTFDLPDCVSVGHRFCDGGANVRQSNRDRIRHSDDSIQRACLSDLHSLETQTKMFPESSW